MKPKPSKTRKVHVEIDLSVPARPDHLEVLSMGFRSGIVSSTTLNS